MKSSCLIVLACVSLLGAAGCGGEEEEYCEDNVAYYHEPAIEHIGEGLQFWDCTPDGAVCAVIDGNALCVDPADGVMPLPPSRPLPPAS